MRYRYMDETEAEALYIEALDESGPVTVAGIEFYPSRILRESDPVAYQVYMADFLDSMEITTDEDEAGDDEEEQEE